MEGTGLDEYFMSPVAVFKNWQFRVPHESADDGILLPATVALVAGHKSVVFLGDGAPHLPRFVPFMIYGVIFLKSYNSIKANLIANNYPMHFVAPVAAGVAEVAGATCATPLQVLMTVAQNRRGGPLEICKFILKRNGLKGFYKGYLTRSLLDLPTTLILFSLYEHLKGTWFPPEVTDKKFRFYHAAACGLVSGAVAGAITAPLATPDTFIMFKIIKGDMSPSQEWKAVVERFRATKYFSMHTGMRSVSSAFFGTMFLGFYQLLRREVEAPNFDQASRPDLEDLE